jgi:hypothetical protein
MTYYCEFTGNTKHDWDEVGFKKRCEHIGIVNCMLHNQPLKQKDGWRVCCSECKTPVQVK